ncbi:MAG: MATE family efflux transporter [Lachnospiraceae bacterium]|nr:MATE family efflux transporter [Lachnospiraceae bacterium]
MTKDLTEGKPLKLILKFAIPLLFGLLFQQFYSVIDTMIVGKFLGSDALAAVGSTGSVNFMVIGFCMGVCNGFAIPVAQQFGAKREIELRKYVANAAWLCVLFAIIMTALTTILCRPILEIMRTPDDIINQAYSYIFIIFAGIPAMMLYNMLAGIIRSLGDSKTPVAFLALSSIINIILDVVLIYYFKMGVAGAAYATVISQIISGICCFFFMRKKYEILKITKEEWKFDSHYALILCGMGIPMGLQYSITAIGSVILQTAVNSLGTVYVSSMTAASKLSIFFCCPFDALGSTMATYGGQNVGAGKIDRLGKGLKACILLGAAYSVIALVVYIFFAPKLSLLFLDASEVEIIANAKMCLIANGMFYFALALVNIVRFMIQGMGFSSLAVFAGVFEMIARGIVGFVFVPIFGYRAACFASPAAWVMADIFLIPAYIYCVNKLKKQIGTEKV